VNRWSGRKAQENIEKHGVSFEEAWTIFGDPLVQTYPDPDHSLSENRFLAVGHSATGILLITGFTIIGDQPWLITARAVTRAEKRRYMRGDEISDALLKRHDDDEDDDLRPFYEFDKMKGIVGKHYFPYLGIRVTLDEDVARYFPTEDLVNAALRVLIDEGRATEQPPPPRTRIA
jgi:hypothetical protein